MNGARNVCRRPKTSYATTCSRRTAPTMIWTYSIPPTLSLPTAVSMDHAPCTEPTVLAHAAGGAASSSRQMRMCDEQPITAPWIRCAWPETSSGQGKVTVLVLAARERLFLCKLIKCMTLGDLSCGIEVARIDGRGATRLVASGVSAGDQVMSELTAVNSTAGGGQPEVTDAVWVIRRAEELLTERDPLSAREIVREALEVYGRRAGLLWVLAEAEFAVGDAVAGREFLAEAVAASPRDHASVTRQIRFLRNNGFWREALSAVQSLPGEVREDPLVRAAAGDFYRACGCPAHAADTYGPRYGLPSAARTSRWWCWLRSGGPFGLLHRSAYAREKTMLQALRHPSGYISSILDVEGLDVRQAQRVRAQLETLDYRYRQQRYGWMALNRAGYRLIPLAVVPVWLVLLAVVSTAGFTPGQIGMQGYAAISAIVAMIPVIAVVFAVLEPTGQFRRGISITWSMAIAFFLAVAVIEAAAGEAYASRFLPTAGWPSAVILGLLVSPAAVAWLPAAAGVVSIYMLWQSRQMIRHDPLLAALDSLLLVRYDLKSSNGYRGMTRRLYHSRLVQFAGRCLTRDLLPEAWIGYLGSGDWLTHRAAGWAEAIRHMQRQIIAPVPGRQAKLEALLTHEILCLASGDLGALAWREPPPPLSRRATLRRWAISSVRAIVVAALPLAVVLTVQPFLHASPGLFSWARITTGIWALLYVLLSIDPTMRDKLGAARDLADLIHTTAMPISQENQRQTRTG